MDRCLGSALFHISGFSRDNQFAAMHQDDTGTWLSYKKII